MSHHSRTVIRVAVPSNILSRLQQEAQRREMSLEEFLVESAEVISAPEPPPRPGRDLKWAKPKPTEIDQTRYVVHLDEGGGRKPAVE